MTTTNPYQELIASVPKGPYYDARGEIVPTRSSPYVFPFETGTPNRRFGLFVNGIFRGIFDTNGDGVALVQVTLDPGEQILELIDEQTRAAFRAYVTVRAYATWMAAHADIFQSIDQKNADLRAALSIQTVPALYAGDVYGRALRQPNDNDYLNDAYRNVLQELRQAYRLWGARPAGLRQAIQAITSVGPFRVPQTWQPHWYLEDTLIPSDLHNTSALLTSTTFATLNSRSVDFVATFSGTATPAPPPYTNPPEPQPLTVTFDAPYLGSAAGDVLIDGLDESGRPVTDTFLRLDAMVARPVLGVIGARFQTVTAIRLSAVGVGVVQVGLAESQFIRFVEALGPLSPSGGPAVHTITLLNTTPFSLLHLDGGVTRSLVGSGRYRLAGNIGYFGGASTGIARIDGLAIAATAATPVTYNHADRLHFQVDGSRTMHARLNPGLTADTFTNIAAFINAALEREESLGANLAFGTIIIANYADIDEGDTVTIQDGFGTVAVFEADSDFTVGSGHIPFAYAVSNTATRDALKAQINRAGILTRATASGSANIALKSELGGLPSNVLITIGGTGTGIARIGMAFGASADAPYLTRASVISDTNGAIIQIKAGNGSIGPAGSVTIVPNPVDASLALLGFPRARSALDGSHSAQTTALDCSVIGTQRFPTFPPIVIHDSLSSTATGATSGFVEPTEAVPMEVWFSPDYDGGNIVLDGTTCEGNEVIETLTYPGNSVVDSGIAGTGQFQTGGRAANSPGVLAFVDIGGADGATAIVRIYNILAPGALGNTYTVTVIAAGANPAPIVTLTVFDLTVQLGTVGANNTGLLIAAAIEAQTNFLAVPTGSGVGQITAASIVSMAAFHSGVDDGRVVHLTQRRGRPGEFDFSNVRPGMMLRLLSGSLAGNMQRIIYVGLGARAYPSAAYLGSPRAGEFSAHCLKLRLETPFSRSFLNEDWEVVEPVVVQGSVPYTSLTSLRNAVGTVGRFQVRIRDGVRDYGIPIRVGRGERASGTGGVLKPDGSFTSTGGGFYTPDVYDFGGVLRVSGSTTYALSNNGLHTISRIDPQFFNTVPWLFLTHEHVERGQVFNQRPNSLTDWSVTVDDDGLAWRVYSAGEVVQLIGNDVGSGLLTIAEPGLIVGKAASAFVEDAHEVATRQGLAEGLDEIDVDIDMRLLPSGGPFTESVTLTARPIPDGWRLYNIDESTSHLDVWGRTNDLHLRLQSDGGSDLGGGLTIEFAVPRALDYIGQTLRVSVWVEQMISASENFRIDVSFDGASFVLGTPQAVPLSVMDSTSSNGGGLPTQVRQDFEVPTDATTCVVRFRQSATSGGSRIFIERVIVTPVRGSGLFGGLSNHETHAEFGEVLYVWSPDPLNDAERGSLGVPTGHAATTAVPGHIDRITNAHGYWERADVSEYDSASPPSPLNLVGIYDENAWLTATLVNLMLEPLIPGRLSFVRPEAPTLVHQVLSFVAPSDATLALPSRHEGPFPEAAFGLDTLYQDGVPVPSTPYPGTHATATIGSGDSAVLVTIDALSTASDSYTITVDASLAVDRPLKAVVVGFGITVELAVFGGALDGPANIARIVAAALDALPGITATYLPGDGSDPLAAEGPNAFTGAQATPWRFTSATAVQIASTLAGDSADVAYYPEGVLAVPGSSPVFDSTSTYTLDYEQLTRATSPVIDLGVNHADYLWLVDATIYRRTEPELIERDRVAALLFRTNYTAVLDEPAVMDQTRARLLRDTGLTRVEIPLADWSFVDQRTLKLDPAQFLFEAIYTLEYVANTARFPRVVDVLIEHKSATSTPALATASWHAVELDTAVGRPASGAEQYHQLRITLTGIVDIRDVRIKTVGLRGIKLYATEPYAPGVIPCTEET